MYSPKIPELDVIATDEEEWEPPVRREWEWEDKLNVQDVWTTGGKAKSQVYWTRERLLKRAARKGQCNDAKQGL